MHCSIIPSLFGLLHSLPWTEYDPPFLLPLCLLKLINPLGDETNLERVDILDPGRFLGVISQSILIIVMNTIYHQLLTSCTLGN